MNRFSDLLEALKARPGNDAFKRLIETIDQIDTVAGRDDEPRLKLPYSSDPTPIDEPWA